MSNSPTPDDGGVRRASNTVFDRRDWLEITLSCIGDGVITADATGRVNYLNPAAEKLTGWTLADAAGNEVERVFQIVNEETRAPVEQPVRRVIERGLTVGLGNQTILIARDGSERPIDDSAAAIKDDQENIVGVVLIFRDVTDRKRTTDAVATSEVRFRRLFEAARDGILLLDPDTRRITDGNPFMVELLGYPRDQLVGKELWEIGLLTDERASREAFSELQRTGTIRYENLPLQAKTGARREVEFVSNLYQENGHPVIQCNIRDITERRRLEEERDRLYRVAEEARARAEANEALLADTDRRKDEFLAILAHELRNPLSSISLAAHLLQHSHAGAQREWSLEVITRQVEALKRLIEDLLDVSRISKGKIHLRKEVLDLSVVIRHAVDSVAALIGERGHELTVSLPHESMMVEADPMRLEQVFVNLITNAAKFTQKGGRIALTAEAEGEHFCVRVSDTGEGIAAEMLPRLFAMFTQVGSSTGRSRGGLGIGLSLVKNLVAMHGGTVTATSEGIGKGSEFVVRLPADRTEH